MISNTFKERYRNHIKSFTHKKIFERNGTFETRLAAKAKQNRFHHKMVHNKKVYFFHGMIQKMQFTLMFGRKNYYFEKKTCLLNERSE